MITYLVLDTETTGLPKNYRAPVRDVGNWPRLIQIAWIVYDDRATCMRKQSYLVKPDGFKIPPDATAIHGITNEMACANGSDLRQILADLSAELDHADYVVAHNINFDTRVVGAEYYRLGLNDPLPAKSTLCTMELATDFCQIPGPYGYKYPKLGELHFKLFRSEPAATHSAMADAETAARCFWELRRLGVITPQRGPAV